MTKVRSDAWSFNEDYLLKATVINHILKGSTHLKAFAEVGDRIGRTDAAVAFRWNYYLRKRHEKEVEQAKETARKERKSKHKPLQQEMILEAKPAPKKKISTKPSYIIELDLFSDFDQEDNPEFACDSHEKMMEVVDFFTDNGYRAIVKRKRG